MENIEWTRRRDVLSTSWNGAGVPTQPSVSSDNINSGNNCIKLWLNSSASPIAQAEWLSGAQAAGYFKQEVKFNTGDEQHLVSATVMVW
ncbi:hypothetical protein E2C01_025147 [Portunus trituberculatus]|uniref:Uncharacterized protein n=1 Tax=Portunus trituberculatus TaxID=210409 RepID=A0A5B7EET3_PORTR|nr:hypothetical protein [Portunus trituberculatus]